MRDARSTHRTTPCRALAAGRARAVSVAVYAVFAVFAVFVVFAVIVATSGVADAKKEDAREQTAREFYASGKYREAIAVFAQIYATTPHPNYLFNIGRCYQNLPDPDHAIISFKDYLRKSPKLSAAERQEIDGYIQEMTELRKNRGAAESALSEIGPKEAPVAVPGVAPTAAPPTVAASTGTAGAAAPPTQGAAGTNGSTAAAPMTTTAAAPKAPAAAESPTAASHANDHPSDPGSVQLATWHARGEALWKEQSARADDAKLAQVEGMLTKAKADDPRRAEYALFLGRLYAARHFRTRLQANESRKLDTTGAPAVGGEDRKALDAEANASFLKSVAAYLEASKAKSFPRADEALYQLAMILDANNMDARATVVLNRLVRTMPDSKLARQVAAGASAGTPPP
jgi:tetratricopeptide (TPR) repeat protein